MALFNKSSKRLPDVAKEVRIVDIGKAYVVVEPELDEEVADLLDGIYESIGIADAPWVAEIEVCERKLVVVAKR
ncbi:MAG: hypothetical protein QXU93_05490 [Thermoproteus sp.]